MENLKFNHIYSEDIEKSGSHIDFIFSPCYGADKDVQGGLHKMGEFDILVSVIRRSAWVFDLNNDFYESYISEKLKLHAEEAKVIKSYLEKFKEIYQNHKKNHNI